MYVLCVAYIEPNDHTNQCEPSNYFYVFMWSVCNLFILYVYVYI